MKKLLAVALTVVMLLAVCVPVFAVDYTPIALYGLEGQDVNCLGNATTTPPTIDGAVNDGEYAWTKTITKDTAGVNNAITKAEGVPGYVKVGVSYDDAKIYVSFVVQENEYTKKGSTYSQFIMNIGFKKGLNIDAAMSRFTSTLSINTDDTCFSGDNYMVFNGNNVYASDWAYMNTLETAEKFTRGTDADGKAITTYELALDKEVIRKAFGLEELGNWCYFYFEVKPTVGGAACGSFAYRCTLNDAQKDQIKSVNGWSPTFVPHVLYFGTKAEEFSAAKATLGEFNAAAAKPYQLADKGQQVNYVGAPTETAPAIDGVVNANEYTFVKSVKAGDAGTYATNTPGVDSADYYIAYDNDYIYLATVVHEETHTVGSKNAVTLCLGFDRGGKANDGMNRLGITLRIDAAAQFAGAGAYYFSAKGTSATKWDYNSADETDCLTNEGKLIQQRKYIRDDAAKTTTYEIKLRRSVIRTVFGADAMDDFGYFYGWATTAGGDFRYAVALDDATKDAFTAANGWSPTFFGHVVYFAEEPGTPDTGDDAAINAAIIISAVALAGVATVTCLLVYRKRREEN